MASSLLYPATMGTPTDGPPAGDSSTSDLGAFNRWLCLTRLRAAAAVAAFATVIAPFGLASINLIAVFAVCGSLALTSLVGLSVRPLRRVPVGFFYAQTAVDLVAITLGIGFSMAGQPAVLFHLIYILVIVPASLFSSPAGIRAAIVATIGHELLVGFGHGFAPAAFVGVESLIPVFLFFLIAHQTAFYGSHLHEKNRMLTGLAESLKESRKSLAAEGRLSAALVDAAQTLSASVEAPALFEHLTRTTREQLCADWGATFLVDLERNTFHMAAATDSQLSSGELSRIEFPLSSWSAVGRLTVHRVVVLNGRLAEGTPPRPAPVDRVARADHGAPRSEPPRGRPPAGPSRFGRDGRAPAYRLPAAPRELGTGRCGAAPRPRPRPADDRDRRAQGENRRPEPHPQRAQVHRARARDALGADESWRRRRDHRRGQRPRHPTGSRALRLRDVPPGARLGRRRRGPRSAHRAALRSGARRRGPGLEPGWRRDALHGHAAIPR